MKQMRTNDVMSMMDDPAVALIDVRPPDAYNGWRQRGEPRGGHIRGARSLPAKWAQYLDWIEIVQSKGIQPDQQLILYGYDRDETQRVAEKFLRMGYPGVAVYHEFAAQWSADQACPMDRLARYRQLVSPQWLKQLLEEGTAPEYENDRFVLCHAHYQNRGAYEEGHIPGAIDLDTNELESPETWNRRSPEELKAALERHGITHDTTVVLYGRFSFPDNDDPFPGSSAGHLGAIRCAFIMMYAGVKDVRVLNGGLQSWLDAGYEVTTEETPKQAVAAFGSAIPVQPELAVDLPEAVDILAAADKNLVCVRSWREYIGQMSGYHYIETKGRIPGAVFADCGSDAYHMENYRNLDHTTREFHEIDRIWRGSGITPEKRNAFYCGTGWRASEAFLNAWLMGWPRVAVFDGGWFEWSNHHYPYETGVPEGYELGARPGATDAVAAE